MDGDIFVMNDDGSQRRRLTRNILTKDSKPRWSPDGKKIAFIRYMDKDNIQTSGEVFIMNADGTNQQRLTHNNVAEGYPSWSSDGNNIAFSSGRNGKHEVYVMEVANQIVQQLTGVDGDLSSTAPDWSPDGALIVYEKFISNGGGLTHKNIYVMSLNGEDQRPLFPDPGIIVDTIIMRFEPRWSTDGQNILFDECRWQGEEQKCLLTVLQINGKTQVITDIYDRLGNDLLIAGSDWMENDRAILCGLKLLGKPTSNYDLYRYEFNTRSLRRLTRNALDEKHPDWIEGALPVSPQDKLPTRWGEKKQDLSR